MQDYFATRITGRDRDEDIKSLWSELYDLDHCPQIWLGLNLQWPSFNLPNTHSIYLISWHTEYMDIKWMIEQCKKVYPAQVICVTDWYCDLSHFGLDNLVCISVDTIHKQLQLLCSKFGIAKNPTLPKYKISSLSARFSQYKKFITAYLMGTVPHNDMILTWHNWIAKTQDLHEHPLGIDHLDSLDFSLLNDRILLNFNDDFDLSKNAPISNGNWQCDPFVDTMVNLTNESYHYSLTTFDGNTFFNNPGPYLTEKTWKPLLAGRPFLVIGQFQSYQRLRNCGLSTQFGFDVEYDNDPGDLTRIGKIFKVLDEINSLSIQELFDRSEKTCRHNLDFIVNGGLHETVNFNNKKNIAIIKGL
jgi:hypothetical protein